MNLRTTRYHLPAFALGLCLATSACASQAARGDAATGPPAGPLNGRVTVDGSSTVLPVSRAMADTFQKTNAGVQVAVAESGTGGGFQKLCAGQVDLIGASRPINGAESGQCEANRVRFIELPVAFDSLTVVVNPKNTFVDCLTVAELKTIWEPKAEGTVTRWNQVRSSFPAQPLTLFGPGKASGTFDYFTLAIVGTQSSSRNDATTSEDDTELVNGIAADPNALGYFGFAYYVANRDKLKLVAIDGGQGCVVPSADTVTSASYQPLSRPLFVYATTTAVARPEVKAFARSYVNPENAARVRDLGYVPLPTATLLSIGRRLDAGTTGSIFGGKGSVLGVTAEAFQDEDRIKNALVR
jgi:phosphate transport system substrate-binding protein